MPLTRTLPGVELIDAAELAARIGVSVNWIKDKTRRRVPDPIPHLKLGRAVRYEWGSLILELWLRRHHKQPQRLRLVCWRAA